MAKQLNIFKNIGCTEFENIVKNSKSAKEVAEKLGYSKMNNNWRTIKKYIKYYSLDISHFIRNPNRPRLSSETCFIKNSSTTSTIIKQLLFKNNIMEHKCKKCGLTHWFDKEIPLELHHIDGNNKNNELTNLSLLCPNCHAQTDNYKGKNIKTQSNICKKRYSLCTVCLCKKVNNISKLCINCYNKIKPKIEWPDYDTLVVMINSSNKSHVAKKLGVSFNAVKKHLNRYSK